MSEERLNLIKENVYTRCSIANITGIGITAPDKEEVELIEEIERLNNIINEFDKLIENEINESKLEEDYDRVDVMEYCLATLREIKGSDKE